MGFPPPSSWSGARYDLEDSRDSVVTGIEALLFPPTDDRCWSQTSSTLDYWRMQADRDRHGRDPRVLSVGKSPCTRNGRLSWKSSELSFQRVTDSETKKKESEGVSVLRT
ncbi:hypothetical protein N7492_006903 [Penicillium capsulatum]|uniref:Uncharacterized protein n=1 Tax=Penicillium capsulatum TaxID=69766 RepID=A0A9W9I1A0_9EURO|nr:hypothetical protein N7492_006903 [Penicillium capsulatum]